MKTLTKAEEQIMQVIWKLEKAFLKEIIDELPVPKPHNNTVATIIKILTEKEFVGIKVFGRYQVGLNNINDIDNKDKWKGQAIQLGVGFNLF